MNEGPHIRITQHAAERGKERLRLNEASLARAASRAASAGMPMAETHGYLRNWLEQKMRKNGKGSGTMIHAGAVFIIENRVLITVYPLPDEYRLQVQKWLAKNPAPARSSTSLKDPRSGVVTPETGRESQKRVLNAIKSPVLGDPRPGGAA